MSKKDDLREKKKEYNMKSDFLSLGIIFTVFIVFLAGLYYYNQQNDILTDITKQLMNLF
ncbi:MAG: hypothetical protein KAQ64_02655 [Candidatus Pacebacteria bacterium]|nr:hypothetical protein [Candidatus Paceibacterota bacterium]